MMAKYNPLNYITSFILYSLHLSLLKFHHLIEESYPFLYHFIKLFDIFKKNICNYEIII